MAYYRRELVSTKDNETLSRTSGTGICNNKTESLGHYRLGGIINEKQMPYYALRLALRFSLTTIHDKLGQAVCKFGFLEFVITGHLVPSLYH